MYSIYVNTPLFTPTKYLTEEGDVIGFEPTLERELSQLGISLKNVAEAVSLYIRGDEETFNIYISTDSQLRTIKIYEVTFVQYSKNITSYLMISNFPKISEILITRLFTEVANRLVNEMRNANKLIVEMGFPYKIIVFETFNKFNKEFNAIRTGFAKTFGEDVIVSISNTLQGLIWPIDRKIMQFSEYDEMDVEIKKIVKRMVE
ncbi:hypothetical protein HS7_18730 [Sulfolobales archaeon HS-7]|nr:hypothetical protein HS7_18730 [Sulfolobales archaeon HS-7]